MLTGVAASQVAVDEAEADVQVDEVEGPEIRAVGGLPMLACVLGVCTGMVLG